MKIFKVMPEIRFIILSKQCFFKMLGLLWMALEI